MNDIARIRFGNGSLIMPARSRYERELVFEQAEFYARRHGQVRLELDRREMLISAAPDGLNVPCWKCGQRDGARRFIVSGRRLCGHCVRTYRAQDLE
jgi:hypothetical protein